MAVMTLELRYIFKNYIIKCVSALLSALLSISLLNVLRWNFSKIAEMIDIVVENTHEKKSRELVGTDFSLLKILI